jgi:uncharacterized protein
LAAATFIRSGNEQLRVVIHPPQGRRDKSKGTGAVVLAHGLANDLDEAGQFPALAERLSASGHTVVRFDFRRGSGEGPPRHLPASEWPHDLLNAVAYTRGLPDVDPERVLIVGASSGGSVGLVVAAIEHGVRGVATLGCFADGERWFRELWSAVHGDGAWDEFMRRVARDRLTRSGGHGSLLVPLIGGFLPVAESGLRAAEDFVRSRPGMLTDLPLEVVDDLLLLSPEAWMSRIEAPVLLIHGTDDELVPLTELERLAEAAGPRARTLVIEGGVHQLLLDGSRDRVIDELVAWSHECLR